MTATVRRDLGAGLAGPCDVVQFLLSIGSPRSRWLASKGSFGFGLQLNPDRAADGFGAGETWLFLLPHPCIDCR
jgi:hypothetical protein